MLANMLDHVKQRMTAFRLACEAAHRITSGERERIQQTLTSLEEEVSMVRTRLASLDHEITPTIRMKRE